MSSNDKGLLKNLVTEKSISLIARPVTYNIRKAFSFDIMPVLKSAKPVILFKGAEQAVLDLSLVFNRDFDQDTFDRTQYLNFFKSLHQINTDTNAVPEVLFEMGNFKFQGYVSEYRTSYGKFNSDGVPLNLSVELKLFSSGDYEA